MLLFGYLIPIVCFIVSVAFCSFAAWDAWTTDGPQAAAVPIAGIFLCSWICWNLYKTVRNRPQAFEFKHDNKRGHDGR